MKLKLKTNRPLLQVLLGVSIFALVMLIHQPLSARVVINYGDCAFQDNCSQGDGSSTEAGVNSIYRSATIGSLIVDGAGYFLKAHSDILLFLNKFELAELYGADYAELQQILDSAIINMENSRDTYVHLIAAARSTPYEEAFIQKLMDFKYDKLQKEKGFCDEIFEEVRCYLSAGDVRGYIGSFQSKLEDLLTRLYKMREFIGARTLPPVEDAWALSHKCSETSMSGLYSAEVFYSVK